MSIYRRKHLLNAITNRSYGGPDDVSKDLSHSIMGKFRQQVSTDPALSNKLLGPKSVRADRLPLLQKKMLPLVPVS